MDYSKTSKELDNWFGFQTPIFIITVFITYLLLIYKILPAYMKNRAPYNLKTFISVYNVVQVVACTYIVVQILKITSNKVFYFWKCSFFDPNTQAEYIFNRVSYFTFWLKIAELSETIIFVLRKKYNQVSYLHVFHHVSTITLIYLLLKYYRGGASLYPLILNSLVHIVMYSYYLAAAHADERTAKRLLPIKKSITTIQMVQFSLILLQVFVSFRLCVFPRTIAVYYCIVIGVIFYGFYDFYKKSYVQGRNQKKGLKSY